jgi:hypothetical protein
MPAPQPHDTDTPEGSMGEDGENRPDDMYPRSI